jgi:hypothetical protein
MKQNYRHITVTLLASLIFLVGSGVNYIHYCCPECSAKGIAEIAKELSQPTATAENPSTSAKGDDCCASKSAPVKPVMSCNHSKKKDCCKVTRLQIDLNDQFAKISTTPDLSWEAVLIYNAYTNLLVNAILSTTQQVYPPPLYSSRHLLSLKSVLLI